MLRRLRMSVPVWKRLLPIPFVILAVVSALVAFRSTPPQPQADTPATSSSSASPVPSGSAVDAPLTKKEQHDISIRLSPSQCEEVQVRVQQMPGPPPSRDPKSITLMANCMRHGNVAFAKCAAGAQTRTEIQVCSRRYLFNEASP